MSGPEDDPMMEQVEEQPQIAGATVTTRERTPDWNEEGFQRVVDHIRATLKNNRMLGVFVFHMMRNEEKVEQMDAAAFSYGAKDVNPAAFLNGIHTVAENMLMPAVIAQAAAQGEVVTMESSEDPPAGEPPSDEALEGASDTPPESPRSH
jgi:hypothetical protein